MRSSAGCPRCSPGVLEGSNRRRSFWGQRVVSGIATEARSSYTEQSRLSTHHLRGYARASWSLPSTELPLDHGAGVRKYGRERFPCYLGCEGEVPRQAVPRALVTPLCLRHWDPPPRPSAHQHILEDVEGVKGQDECLAAQLGVRLVSGRSSLTTN